MLIVFVVMLVVMMVTAAALVIMVVMVMMVTAAGGAGLLSHQIGGKGVALLHGLKKLRTGQLIPGSGDDGSVHVVTAQKANGAGQLALVHLLGAAEDNSTGMADLVLVELAEILEVNSALGGIGHGDSADQLHLGDLANHILHGLHDIAELANAGGFNDDSVGMELFHDLLQRLAEVTHQRAADAAGVHLGDLDPGFLKEAAIDADLAEFVFNEDELLAAQGLVQKLFDKCGFTGAQEAGNNTDLGHRKLLFSYVN